jgi:DNA-binding NarL/FixJ family response regulator
LTLLLARHPEKKVIALSMYSDYENYYDMIRSGARGFVLKQSSSNELEKAVRDVSNGGSFFSTELLQNIIFNLSGSSTRKNREEDIPELTKKEIELLKFICQGLSNKELAEKMFLSVKTVESQKTKLICKTEVKNTSGLIIWAIKNKVVNF